MGIKVLWNGYRAVIPENAEQDKMLRASNEWIDHEVMDAWDQPPTPEAVTALVKPKPASTKAAAATAK